MDFYDLLCYLEYIVIGYCTVQVIRLVVADGDLVLMWNDRFGKTAESMAGQVIWITGASSGMGADLAYWLAKGGCRLILSARRKHELEKVKVKCQVLGNLSDDDVLVLPLDVCDFDSHKRALEEALNHFDRINVLVNNAGRSQRSLIKDTDWLVDQQMVDLNLMGQVSLTKTILPHFIQKNGGQVVVTSSMAGKLGLPNSATYCLTKFGLHGWFESLRMEGYEHNIDVTMACPGPVLTPFLEVAFTGTPGKNYGVSATTGENRMTSERCGHLIGVAMANKLDEVWIAKQPWLMFCYMAQYMPAWGRSIGKRMGMKTMAKLRDATK